MKQRTAERLLWPRITARRFVTHAFATAAFQGVASLLCIDAVREPFWVEWQGRSFCICDGDYTWLQHFPVNTHYAVTTMFDPQGQVIQWYIDICHRHWVDDKGVPWWEDLYLDLLVFPVGDCHIVDGDELDEALQTGVIDARLHRLAWDEAHRLQSVIQADAFPLLSLSYDHRLQLLQMLDSK
jgi:predicted RNA-binding protein associated with RNAse of E/G family